MAVLAVFLLQMQNRSPAPAASISTAPKAEAPKPVTAKVLTYARDLKTGEKLAAADLTWTDWPTTPKTSGYVYRTQGAPSAQDENASVGINASAGADGPQIQPFVGAYLREPVQKGEPVLAGKMARGGDGGYLAVTLNPGMRAFAIRSTPETSVGGFILPGDRVDVIFNAQGVQNEPGRILAQTIMRNVRVMAIDQTTDRSKGPIQNAQTITLEVGATDLEPLTRAKTLGTLSLALRSYADLKGGPTPANFTPVTAVARTNPGVTIYRRGQASTSTVAP